MSKAFVCQTECNGCIELLHKKFEEEVFSLNHWLLPAKILGKVCFVCRICVIGLKCLERLSIILRVKDYGE